MAEVRWKGAAVRTVERRLLADEDEDEALDFHKLASSSGGKLSGLRSGVGHKLWQGLSASGSRLATTF